jgi:hypothetical protein
MPQTKQGAISSPAKSVPASPDELHVQSYELCFHSIALRSRSLGLLAEAQELCSTSRELRLRNSTLTAHNPAPNAFRKRMALLRRLSND